MSSADFKILSITSIHPADEKGWAPFWRDDRLGYWMGYCNWNEWQTTGLVGIDMWIESFIAYLRFAVPRKLGLRKKSAETITF